MKGVLLLLSWRRDGEEEEEEEEQSEGKARTRACNLRLCCK
jgi:hypothetical protein